MLNLIEKELPEGWNTVMDKKQKFPLMKCLERDEVKFEAPSILPQMNLAGVVKSTYADHKTAKDDLQTTIKILKMVLLKNVPSYLNHGEAVIDQSDESCIKITIPLYIFPEVSSAIGGVIILKNNIIYVTYAGDYSNAEILAEIIIKNI